MTIRKIRVYNIIGQKHHVAKDNNRDHGVLDIRNDTSNLKWNQL